MDLQVPRPTSTKTKNLPFAEPGGWARQGGRSYSLMWLKVLALELKGKTPARKQEGETGQVFFFLNLFFFLDAKESLCDVLFLAASAST